MIDANATREFDEAQNAAAVAEIIAAERRSAWGRLSRRDALKWVGGAFAVLCLIGPAAVRAGRSAAPLRVRPEADGSYRVQGWRIPH